ncbi:MinD/ParA family protein [Paenibacillus alkalitolerans]|uniref:MinD/ParA family protein n=1 Tax=Paenibacillus alkalitolerans TaxID=2799335 RepID=UPI0018F7C9E6|nr:MinD/ParA family protein [Paenibacillus alkalitolerans]
MNDQAHALRNLVQHQEKVSPADGTAKKQAQSKTRILTVTSGKGGVGKSNFTLNFALALQERGYRVLVFDADIGMANIDVLMGASPQYNLYHLLKREKSIFDIVHQGANGLQFIAGGSGFSDLLSLSAEELNYFSEQVNSLNGSVDFILFDTGAGLSKETLKFIAAAEQTVVVTTPEPTSITDAYAIIKMVHSMEPDVRFQLVVNRVTDAREGKQTADKISMVAKQFLQVDIPTLGYVPDDANVSKAVKKQVPFSVMFPETPATYGVKEIAARFISSKPLADDDAGGGGVKRFLHRMLNFLK